jgi:BlaR1 peptidase M56
MERECCLSMLITLIGGASLLAFGWWPGAELQSIGARRLERIAWRRIWRPVVPALTAAAALCGWALAEPDPVPEKVPWSLVLMAVPFALLFARAAFRSGRALLAIQDNPVTATVGILRPWIIFSPHLAKKLSDRQIEAALEHERAHARHRDPLRIWLAQLATDLQWPWPQAHERLQQWLTTLELARDEEARAAGVDGTDLAEVILASARYVGRADLSMQAALIGEPSSLRERVHRLLDPSPADTEESRGAWHGPLLSLVPSLAFALVSGAIFGERLVHALFRIAA